MNIARPCTGFTGPVAYKYWHTSYITGWVQEDILSDVIRKPALWIVLLGRDVATKAII